MIIEIIDMFSQQNNLLQTVLTVFSLTNFMIYVNQLVQEVFDRGHTAQDDGMKWRHPLLLSVTQLKTQVPDTL